MMQFKQITCTINGRTVTRMVDIRSSLTDLLRNDFRLTSVKKGCEVGECGACNVIIDGECFNSCLYLAAWADGKSIRTLESLLGPNGELSDIQQAFVDEAAAVARKLFALERAFYTYEVSESGVALSTLGELLSQLEALYVPLSGEAKASFEPLEEIYAYYVGECGRLLA